MKIAKPLLIVLTPIGVAGGLYEAYRLAGGLAFVMVMLVTVLGFALATVIFTIRREREELERGRQETAALKKMAEPPEGDDRPPAQ